MSKMGDTRMQTTSVFPTQHPRGDEWFLPMRNRFPSAHATCMSHVLYQKSIEHVITTTEESSTMPWVSLHLSTTFTPIHVCSNHQQVLRNSMRGFTPVGRIGLQCCWGQRRLDTGQRWGVLGAAWCSLTVLVAGYWESGWKELTKNWRSL